MDEKISPTKEVMCNFMTTKLTIIILFWTSLNLSSQTTLKKDSFFLPHKVFPKNYKTIVGDPKGWRALGHYNVYTDKIDLKLSSWDTLSVYTPFNDGKKSLKIRRKRIIGIGDQKSCSKIIYVDNSTLVLEHKWTEKRAHKNRQVKNRTLYRRRT
jgi:hypothetical protein